MIYAESIEKAKHTPTFPIAAVSQTRFTYFDSLILQHFIEYYEKYFFF